MNREELLSKTCEQLLRMAQERRIEGASAMERDALVEAILSWDERGGRGDGGPPRGDQIIEESKYYTGAAEVAVEEERALPDSYGRTKIVLQARDPEWAHAYWEITPGDRRRVEDVVSESWGEARRVLRVHDVTDGADDLSSAHGWYDIEITPAARNWYIHLGRPDGTFFVELGVVGPDGTFHLLARSNVIRLPRDRMSDVVDEEWMTVDYERLYAASGGWRVGESSAELAEMLERGLELNLASGAISSLVGSLERQARPRGFWLVAETELIVYGATEPDATVTVQGRAVRLRPDGTFTLRFALPDGTQEIPVEATSADGVDVRRVTFTVSRSSER